MNSYLVITTLSIYLFAAGMQFFRLVYKRSGGQIPQQILILAAIVLHASLLHVWIDTPSGQNLTFINQVSLVLWLGVSVLWLAAWTKPVASLQAIALPLAAVSIILVILFPQERIVQTAGHPAALTHILLSVLLTGLMWLAGIQAVLLAWQNYLLRMRRPQKIFNGLPPLQVMETLLFQIILLGFVCLTIILATSLWQFSGILTFELMQKLTLAFIVWLCFAVLLLGHYYFGWRGSVVVRWVLPSIILLILIYFCSELLTR